MPTLTCTKAEWYQTIKAYKSRRNKEIKLTKSNKSEYTVALSAGIVPCPGVMTIVLFCIILKQYTLGILAAITMSIGMGLTISVAGILSILINKKSNKLLESKSYILEMIGGLLILLLGLFLFSSVGHK